jgi:hypothetical protein
MTQYGAAAEGTPPSGEATDALLGASARLRRLFAGSGRKIDAGIDPADQGGTKPQPSAAESRQPSPLLARLIVRAAGGQARRNDDGRGCPAGGTS